MSKSVEITAIFLGERHRFENSEGDVIIASGRYVDGPKPESVNGGEIGLKGPVCDDEFGQHLTYRFWGRWTEYKNRRSGRTEQQFAFETFVESQPHGRAGVVAYLEKAGNGLGIGRARAMQLFDAFGSDAVKVCREEPAKAASLFAGWQDAEKFAATLEKQVATESCQIELTELLNKRGFLRSIAKSAIDLWGNCAPDLIRRNPYLLMNFRGGHFLKCDKLYLDLGHPRGRLKRQALAAWHEIASDSEGHTWYPVERAIAGITTKIPFSDHRIQEALELTKRSGILVYQRQEAGKLVDTDGKLWVAESKKSNCELHAAKLIANAKGVSQWPHPSEIDGVTDHQRSELAKAIAGPIGCFGGSPGTGKTFTAAALILAACRKYGDHNVAVCAPTGKAAVRISEAMDSYGVPVRARTIHSLLGVESSSGGGWTFTHNARLPLHYQFVIVDESSMVDVALMSSLLDARAHGTHILYVGDVYQLPPVGHGAPLRDMIAAGLPYGELTEIKRQDNSIPNLIIQACSAIRKGAMYETLPDLTNVDIPSGRNLVRLESITPERQIEEMIRSLDWAKANGFDPIWQCQILAAVNRKSKLCRKELNVILQRHLNHNPGIPGQQFRLADKVVNTKNGFFPLENQKQVTADVQMNLKGEVYVANGELGEVLEVAEKYLVLKLTSPARTIRVPKGKSRKDDDNEADANVAFANESEDEGTSTGCSWELGFCLSCHKSQGSEWPIVITMLDDYAGARMVCSREWIYTANSRGKQLDIEIGKESTAKRFVDRVAIWDRKTLLKERINQFQVGKLLEEI